MKEDTYFEAESARRSEENTHALVVKGTPSEFERLVGLAKDCGMYLVFRRSSSGKLFVIERKPDNDGGF